MLMWSLAFFILAIVAGAFGFTNVASASTRIAKIIFVIFVVLFLGSLVMHII